MVGCRDLLHLDLDLVLRLDPVALIRKAMELPGKLIQSWPVLHASDTPLESDNI